MTELWYSVSDLIQTEQAQSGLKAAGIMLAGLLTTRLVSRRLRAARFEPGRGLLVRRLTGALILGFSTAWALSELGMSLSVLLGAAGVLSVALGFAAQTSVSNVISGLFLMGEGPFKVGDIVTVEGETGEVMSIDFLSVKLRTFDNRLVRIPNEAILKSKVINVTKFPIRRYDLKVGVAFDEDLEKVKDVLGAVAESNPLCLEEPEPLFIVVGFGDSSMQLQFSVWAASENFLEMRNTMHDHVIEAFAEHQIEIPVPHRKIISA